MPHVSIIVRTKNEERWVGHCLQMINKQSFEDFEVVLVDNGSTDNTVKIAKKFGVEKFVHIDKFVPGKAINDGIRASSGDYIVCISAHCVPKNVDWLKNLLANFETTDKIAGVYGRQLPLSFTDDVDKRDLLIVFGLDKRIQEKDIFFHNANSIFPRKVWEKFPFDESVTNIEDRVWGKQVIEAGYKIIYEPSAEVYHHHGLHQGNSPKRVRGVVSIIEQIDSSSSNDLPDTWLPENINVAALLPIRGEISQGSRNFELLMSTINSLKKSKYINKIHLISTQAELAKRLEVGFIDRGEIQDVDALGVDEVLRHSLIKLEDTGEYLDSILYVNYDYVNRPEGLFDKLLEDKQNKGVDTIFAGQTDYGHYWIRDEAKGFVQSDDSLKSRDQRQPLFKALYGLGCITHVSFVRNGKLVGGKVGILRLDEEDVSRRLND